MRKYLERIGVAVFLILGVVAAAQAISLSFRGFGWVKHDPYENLTPDPSYTPESLAFGTGTTSKTYRSSILMTNSGNDTFEGYAASIVGGGASGFSIYSSTTSGDLAAAATNRFKIRFQPAVQQSYSASLQITAPNWTTKLLALTGTGVCTAQTITWNSQPAAMTVGDADQTLNMASASSSLAVAYTTSTTDYCTVVAGALHAVAAGTCVVHANQAGNGTYCAASQVDSGDVTISAASCTETNPNAQTTQDDYYFFGNSGSAHYRESPYTASATGTIKAMSFKLMKTGSPTCTLTFQLCEAGADAAHVGTCTTLGTLASSTLTGTFADHYVNYNTGYAQTSSTDYRIQIYTDGVGCDASNYVRIGANGGGTVGCFESSSGSGTYTNNDATCQYDYTLKNCTQ